MSSVVEGSPQGVRIRDREHFFWWGIDVDDNDRVVTVGKRVLVFPSAEVCAEWAAAEGLTRQENAQTWTLDCDSLRPWLNRATPALDYKKALDVVNMSIDFSVSIGESWDPRFGRSSRAYDGLFAASVPWIFGMETYSPRWNAPLLKIVHAIVERSVNLLDRALGDGVRAD